jgi:sulfur relay (sulfurtransferase) DsrC/TusE family protein
MGAQATIHHRLDLALRLIDTVTGKVILERNTQFFTQSPGKKAIPKGGGLYIFLNIGREEFELDVHVYGYEHQKVKITYPEQEEYMPIREIYLIPLDNPVLEQVLTLRGNLPGIEEIEAVSLTDTNCCIKEFDARKRILSVLNQKNIRFHHIHYGLINRVRTAYEHFEVEKEISLQEIKCKKKLEQEVQINQPIVRVIFGQTNEQGDYVLKVKNDEIAQYLVRFVADGKVFYQKVDFHQEGNALSCSEETQEEKEE